MALAAGFILSWLFVNALLLFVYRNDLILLWQEPAFNKPIVIFESDDWGAGPLTQADALEKILSCLSKYSDQAGRHPVMTLSIILSVADTSQMAGTDGKEYQAIDLNHEKFSDILKVIRAGCEKKVFTIQLHGKEHYWPANLLISAREDSSVRDWLTQYGLPKTEDLPSHLQSRWISTAKLPSMHLSKIDIIHAVDEEVVLYKKIFEASPTVVVPPTFIWTDAVERAWLNNGVQTIVTPGRRLTSRNAKGEPVATGPIILNGTQSECGITYVVRNDYFEPNFGHKAQDKIVCIEQKTLQGRPVLFETHRFNYVGETQDASLAELDKLLSEIVAKFPNVQFISTEYLAEILKTKNSGLIEKNSLKRLKIWMERAKQMSGFWRMAKLSGLALAINLTYRLL